ncbi:hypothetical protein GCM10010106_15790 [Thermopolyspora flexuosa]|nr:hypothetical protein GCM10010106_15790 [Thermopolyspora flexuosa]
MGEAGGPLGTGYGTRAGAHAPASGDARILRAARNRCRTFFFRAFLAVFPHAGAGRDGPAGGSVYLALA